MTPKALILTPDFLPVQGGIQVLVHRIASSFERYRPHVVTLGYGQEEAFDRVQRFSIDRVHTPRRLRRAGVAALNARGLTEAVRQRPAVVLSAHIVTGPAALAGRRLLGLPVVQYVYAQELNQRPALARRVLTRVDAVIAISRHTQSLVHELGVSAHKVHIVCPGVDTPTDSRPPTREPSIVVVSRLDERYKGHDVLLRALPLVRSTVPGTQLHIVGDGGLRGHLESVAHSLGIADAVTFHGRVSDDERDEIVRRASVFAMLSRVDALGGGEGFGIAFLEAGKLGLPVVAGGVAGTLDAVVDGETGIFVEPEDHVAAADAIRLLLSDPELADRFGAAGRERARALSWPRAAAEVEDVLDLVTGR